MRPPTRSRACRTAALVAGLALAATACGTSGASSSGDDAAPTSAGTSAGASPDASAAPIRIVATTSILGDVTQQVVGDRGEVTVLMGPGVDPHAYAPSPRDVAALREADLVVANGLGLEESLTATLEATADAGVPVFELAPQVDPLAFGEDAEVHEAHAEDDDDDDDHAEGDHADDQHADDEHAGHDHGPEDPHVWFDPQRVATGVELLADELAEVAPQDAETWSARAAGYVDTLHEVDAELAAAFGEVPEERRVLVTNHDALGYLAARYGLEVVGTVIPGSSTQAETDPHAFGELVATVEEHRIDAVFADNTDRLRLAEQLASEVIGRGDLEVEVVPVATDALGEPGSATDTYVGLLRETGTTIAATLAG